MNAANFRIDMLLKMAHSPLQNYIVPGLKSSLIGMPSQHGAVRLFDCQRDQQEGVAPHSHRFDFQCWVLAGQVTNRVWHPSYGSKGDLYRMTSLVYDNQPGEYVTGVSETKRWVYEDTTYGEGECYSMSHKEIHSIRFSRGTKVLFFEGPQLRNTSEVLEPVVDGEVVPIFKTEPWMFRKTELRP
jgi:hypothetical protein